MNYYFGVLKKYAVFNGRADRKEFWIFFLINLIIGFVLGFIEGLTGINPGSTTSILGSIYNLAILLPSIGVAIRRMHDIDKSGWYMLIPIYNIILACKEGTAGKNKYGDDPRGGNQPVNTSSET